MGGERSTDSRERMIEASIALMRGSGLSGAGINEIVRASGAPKGSVYHFFPAGKQQLATEALDTYAERVQAFVEAALASRSAPADKVRTLFEAFARRAEEGGFQSSCAVGTVSLDLNPEFAGLRQVLERALDAWIAQIAGHFNTGDARQARSFAGLLMTAIEGAYIRSRAEASSRAFREAGDWLARLAPVPAAAARQRKRAV
ncbi:MAG: TetR/AcrR family transcriptional regulator [Burkholderiaceae bacterium]|nr:TetR/AcrR family transcriptional regulator [Burkholderiaceae bacterium]